MPEVLLLVLLMSHVFASWRIPEEKSLDIVEA
jgi:hypothetical protein